MSTSRGSGRGCGFLTLEIARGGYGGTVGRVDRPAPTDIGESVARGPASHWKNQREEGGKKVFSVTVSQQTG